MPRISAPTVAENREMRRSALVHAAGDLIVERGSAHLSVGEVAARVGLSRSAVYEYYASAADLVADVLIDELKAWRARIADETARCGDRDAAIAAWMTANMDYAADGRHALVRAAGQVELPAARREEITALHHDLVAPLREAIISTGGEPVHVAYVWGVTQAAIDRIEAGADPRAEARSAIAFCTGRAAGPTA